MRKSNRGLTCSIDGCDAPVRGWGLCIRHYTRWKRTGDPLGVRRKRNYCTVDDCDDPAVGHGLCRLHYTRQRSRGTTDLVPRATGPNHHRWLDAPDYYAVHRRLKVARGPATGYVCSADGCSRQAAHWSYDHSDPAPLHDKRRGMPYSTDLTRYRPLCSRCHKTFDLTCRR